MGRARRRGARALLWLARRGAVASRVVAAALRGPVESAAAGTPRSSLPYGERDRAPAVAAIVDYAAQPFDADLGATRMGLRDYQAPRARFLEPDPLFLEHPERCVERPVECALYGYAANRPLDFVDPTGTEPTPAAAEAEVEPTLPKDDGKTLDEAVGKGKPTSRD